MEEELGGAGIYEGVAGGGQAAIVVMMQDTHLGGSMGIVSYYSLKILYALVGRTVVNKDIFEVLIRLLEGAPGALLYPFLHIVNGDENGYRWLFLNLFYNLYSLPSSNLSRLNTNYFLSRTWGVGLRKWVDAPRCSDGVDSSPHLRYGETGGLTIILSMGDSPTLADS